MTGLVKYISKPQFHNPALVVCWESDAGQIGEKVTGHLLREFGGELFCEINPVDFFPLGGVAIEKDEVLFPECAFYKIYGCDLIVFYSAIPRYEWSGFLNSIVDVALETCDAKEIYTIGGMVTLSAHTVPREFWATFNSIEIKESLTAYQLSREMNYETPPGSRPTLNSFLLWTAKQRGLHGANLWVPIPFYLVDNDDPMGQKKVLEFLDHRLDLHLNFARIDTDIMRQDEKLHHLCLEKPDVDVTIKKLENNLRLTEKEHDTLVKEVEEYLRKSED